MYSCHRLTCVCTVTLRHLCVCIDIPVYSTSKEVPVTGKNEFRCTECLPLLMFLMLSLKCSCHRLICVCTDTMICLIEYVSLKTHLIFSHHFHEKILTYFTKHPLSFHSCVFAPAQRTCPAVATESYTNHVCTQDPPTLFSLSL